MATHLTIKRHAVITGASGMSDYQEQLLDCTSRIRLGSAPTGSGKSFAFLQGVLRGKRVLFVVPTRRLARNLIASLQRDMKQVGWSNEQIRSKIALWSSDGTQEMKGAGIKNITQLRLKQLSELSPLDGGEIVVTTPESLAWLIMNPQRFPVKHFSDRSVLDVIADFDHLVFDEMHTIEPRGLSLSLIMAWLCEHLPNWKAKLTYLSATPVDLSEPFSCFGLNPEKMAVLVEQVFDLEPYQQVNGMRVIHGDVKLNVFELPITQIVSQQQDLVKAELNAGRQVVLIYDRLFEGLSNALPELKHIFSDMGIPPEKVLLISSADDSQQGEMTSNHGNFQAGADKDPADYSVLIATSSIEIGVTFNCRLLFMEPGYSSSSMVQRIGRVARGDFPGEIFLCVSPQDKAIHLWLREWLKWVQSRTSQRVSVDDLTAFLSKDVQKQFGATPLLKGMFARPSIWYERMSGRAAVIAGFAWLALQEHSGLKNHRAAIIARCTPPIVGSLRSIIRPLYQLAKDPEYLTQANKWLLAFNQEVQLLRSFPESVRVINTNGAKWTLSWEAIRKYTDLLDRYESTQTEAGEWELRIDESHWRDAQLNKAVRSQSIQVLLLPHDGKNIPVIKKRAEKVLLDKIEDDLSSGLLSPKVIEAVNALKTLTRMTGLVCLQK